MLLLSMRPAGALDAAVMALFSNGEQGAIYDPRNLSTLFQDSAGTTPVTAPGQPVGKMLDLSGRGNHMVQATAAARPIWTVDANGTYLLTDGVDDSMATAGNVDFTGTNKMTVVVGVTKLSDAAAAILIELSSSVSTNVGAFYISAPETGATYGVRAHGTAASGGYDHATFAAPVTNVISSAMDLSGGTVAAALQDRINGVSTTTVVSGSPPGGGNFGSYLMYMFRRGGATLPFNGRFYGAIIRGAASSATQIAQAEAWANTRARAY